MKPHEEYAAMVARIEPELTASGATYTPRIRAVENFADDCARKIPQDRAAITEWIREVEVAWRTEVARARRQAGQGASR